MAGGSVPTGDIFDAVLNEIGSGARRTPFAKPTKQATAKPKPQSDSGLVAKFADWLGGMSASQRQRVEAAFNAAVQQVNESNDEAEPEETPPAAAQQGGQP
jgi:hypothetical protein